VGSGDESISEEDGWAVDFDKYIATVGKVKLELVADAGKTVTDDNVYVVDLTKIDPDGLKGLWTFEDLAVGRWTFNYYSLNATSSATRHEDSVSEVDFEKMKTGGYSYLIEGKITKTGGQSCPPAAHATPGTKTSNGKTSALGDPCYDATETISFAFSAPAETGYGPCEIDEVPGVAISADSTTTAAMSIHGDHIVFNGFPEGDEAEVIRRAQWIADCDLNLDGMVDNEELKAIPFEELAEIDNTRYDISGARIPLTTVYEYLKAQLLTQGHFQGEGECPPLSLP